MKYFLILLFGSLSFFASAQVCIPDDVARYFLEAADIASVLQRKDSLSNLEITSLNGVIVQKDSIISSFEREKIFREKKDSLRQQELKIKDQELSITKKQLKKQKIQKTFVFIGAGVVLILSLI